MSILGRPDMMPGGWSGGGGGSIYAAGASCQAASIWRPKPVATGTMGQGAVCEVCHKPPQPPAGPGVDIPPDDQGGEATGGYDIFQAGGGSGSGASPIAYTYNPDLSSLPSGARPAWVVSHYRSEGEESGATVSDNGGSQGGVTAPADVYIDWGGGGVGEAGAAVGVGSLAVNAREEFAQSYGNFYTLVWGMGYYYTQ